MKFEMPALELFNVLVPNDKVLVMDLDIDNKTHGGLLLDPRHYDKFKKGVVVLVGPGKFNEDKTKRIPMQLSSGDIVLFDLAIAKQININSKVFNIFDEAEGLLLKIGEVDENGEIELYADTKI